MNQTGITTAARILDSIRADVAADDSQLAGIITAGSAGMISPGFSDLFSLAAGKLPAGEDDYLFTLEYICEGYLLHYGSSRILAPHSREFALLAGDYMYARGLNRLTARGDLESIRLLSGLISFCAMVHCEGLEAAMVADAWAVTTLRVAGLASGAAGDTAGAGINAGVDRESVEGKLKAALDSLLASYPPRQGAVMQDELCNIYDSFNQQRRQDGTQ